MFADSLLDSAWKQSSRRHWTTVASFTLQAVGIGVLLLIPIIYTQGLPQLARVIDIPVPAPQGPPPASTLAQSRRSAPLSNFRDGMLMTPSRIPPRYSAHRRSRYRPVGSWAANRAQRHRNGRRS